MAIKNKFIHFNTRAGFDNNMSDPTDTTHDFYNYTVFIKDTQEIYTHGQFYKCSEYDDTELRNLISGLTAEVEENELVAAEALTLLEDNKVDRTELAAIATSGSYEDLEDKPTVITGIMMNGVEVESSGGLVDLGTVITDIDEEAMYNDLASVAFSGSYYDLWDTPTIPTDSTVSGWGFTKNTGTITAIKANGTSVATSGVANIPAATTSKYGVTKLSSATNSTSTALAATASAVKAAYDLAASKTSNVGTITGIKMNGEVVGTSGVVDLGTISGGTAKPANNEIWYTTTDGLPLEDASADGDYAETGDDESEASSVSTFNFYPDDANTILESNTYENGKGMLTFGEDVTHLYGMFMDSETLQTVVLPESVTYISNNAFEYCYNLRKLVIPKNVTFVGGYLCPVTTTVVFTSTTPPEMSEYIFWDSVQNIIVPSAGYQEYVDATSALVQTVNVIPSGCIESANEEWFVPMHVNTGTIDTIKVNGTTVTSDAGVVNIPAASTSAYGVTKLSTSTSSTSTTLAATASAVRAAYVLASGKQAALVSGTNIKTINNTSLLGSGNITVGAKPLVTFSSNTIAMDPNKYYRLTTAQSRLTITFNTPSDNTILNEYFIEFPCESDNMTLSLSSEVMWTTGDWPTFEAGKTYQLSVVNNLAVIVAFYQLSS